MLIKSWGWILQIGVTGESGEVGFDLLCNENTLKGPSKRAKFTWISTVRVRKPYFILLFIYLFLF